MLLQLYNYFQTDIQQLQNNSFKMKNFIFTSLFASAALFAQAQQSANVQIIHNCANPGASLVDIWINNLLELEDINFRTATGYVGLPAGVPLNIAVIGAGSPDTVGAFQFVVTLTANENYVVVASGTAGDATDFSPVQPFDLKIYSGARRSAQMPANTDILVMHGCTDAPTVDVRNAANNGVLVDDISYGTFATAGYLSLPANANYVVNVTDATGATTVASYQAPLQTLNLAGAAITVLASGFLTPSANSNGPSFGLWVAPSTGGALIQLPLAVSVNETAQLENLSMFPNPAQDVLNIAFNAAENTDLSIQISDVVGKSVYTQQLGAINGQQNLQISTQNLPNGVYQVALVSNKGLTTQKIMIQR